MAGNIAGEAAASRRGFGPNLPGCRWDAEHVCCSAMHVVRTTLELVVRTILELGKGGLQNRAARLQGPWTGLKAVA